MKRWGEIGWCCARQQILFGPQDAAPPSGVGWGSTEELASRVVAKRLVLKRIGLPLTFIPAKGHGNVRRLRQWFRGQAWQAGFAGRKAPVPARGGVPCTGWGGGKSLAGIYINNQIAVCSFFM